MAQEENFQDEITDMQELTLKKMSKIKHKILVMSGKGGVGKTTVASNIAYALASFGHKVGILDADITGPNVPKLFGVEKKQPEIVANEIQPLEAFDVKIVSMDSLLTFSKEPVLWRGPMIMKAIVKFLNNVNWGELDYLIVDLAPGTGDESLTVMQLVPDIDGAVIVSIPQSVAWMDVEKSIIMCRMMNVDIIGVVENMSYHICSHCGEKEEIFDFKGVHRFLENHQVDLLGKLPLEGGVSRNSQEGIPFITDSDSKAAEELWKVVEKVEEFAKKKEGGKEN